MPLFVHFISLMKLGYLGPSALIFENYIRYSTKIHYHHYKEDNCLPQILKTVTFSLCVWRDTAWCQYCSLQRLKPAANLQAANQPPWVKTSTGYLLHVWSYTWKRAQHFVRIWVFVWFGFFHGQRNGGVTQMYTGIPDKHPDLRTAWSSRDPIVPSKP